MESTVLQGDINDRMHCTGWCYLNCDLSYAVNRVEFAGVKTISMIYEINLIYQPCYLPTAFQVLLSRSSGNNQVLFV